MTPDDFIEAARVPRTLEPQEFGLWTIQRIDASSPLCETVWGEPDNPLLGFPDYTLLHQLTDATLHQPPGEVVMEDSLHELRRHMPIWLAAHGRVLITGLGLGCVLRGLLASTRVEHVDVVEIDSDIIRIVGLEFVGNPRVTIHHGDALRFQWPEGTRWDCAWHDIWCPGNKGLELLHIELIHNHRKLAGRQGAWMLPRVLSRLWRDQLIGTRRA